MTIARALTLSILVAGTTITAAHAVTITYVTINESIKTTQVCAFAGNNGSGPCDADSATGSSLTFIDERQSNALDTDADQGALAIALGSVSQATFLTAVGVNANGSAVTGAQVFVSGSARADAESELKVAFFVDANITFTIHGYVACVGDCTSFVALYDAQNEPLFDLTVHEGSSNDTVTGTIFANQSYLLWARATTTSAIPPAPGFDNAHGDFSVALDLSGAGGLVPEPETYVLMLVGLLSVGVIVRRRTVSRVSSPV